MSRRWLAPIVALIAGCAEAPSVEIEPGPPPPISTDFRRLAAALEGIRAPQDVVLLEGLPSEFWEPQQRERELKRAKTVRLHGYPFYDDRRALRGADAEPLTALLSAPGSYRRHQASKACGGFQPDYGVEWTRAGAVTRVLICLECQEAKVFGPRSELHCSLSPEAARTLEPRLRAYRKNRPATE